VVDRRRFMIAQGVLALVAVGALALSASVIVRSIRTAKLNRDLAALYAVAGETMEAEIAAPPLETTATQADSTAAADGPFGQLSAMVMPDGTPIELPKTADNVQDQTDAAARVFYRTDLAILPEMQKLAEKNPDTVGWINISGTVHLPVVYRDNTYYIDHDFTGARNASGALFLDENSLIAKDTQNLLIHGHSMNDGSMFGILSHYRKLEFLRKHSLFTFSTLWQKDTYVVFAVLQVSSRIGDADYFNYFNHSRFSSHTEFNGYIEQLTHTEVEIQHSRGRRAVRRAVNALHLSGRRPPGGRGAQNAGRGDKGRAGFRSGAVRSGVGADKNCSPNKFLNGLRNYVQEFFGGAIVC